jgi:hypothetical protein
MVRPNLFSLTGEKLLEEGNFDQVSYGRRWTLSQEVGYFFLNSFIKGGRV